MSRNNYDMLVNYLNICKPPQHGKRGFILQNIYGAECLLSNIVVSKDGCLFITAMFHRTHVFLEVGHTLLQKSMFLVRWTD